MRLEPRKRQSIVARGGGHGGIGLVREPRRLVVGIIVRFLVGGILERLFLRVGQLGPGHVFAGSVSRMYRRRRLFVHRVGYTSGKQLAQLRRQCPH
jgi:hypothetical protein